MTTRQRARKRPSAKDTPSARFLQAVRDEFELTPAEDALVEEAGRVLDTIATLAAELKEAPLTVEGSQGQPVANPLIAELRAQQSELRKMLAQLRVREEPPT